MRTSKPRLLDLFCGAGGTAMGYSRAGFEVVGVDISPQKHYPFEFHRADAMTYPLEGFDVIHASPPCQKYSACRTMHSCRDKEYPDLIVPVRERLKKTGNLYVIENVKGAPLIEPIKLNGLMFHLKLFRERWFEINTFILSPQIIKTNEVIGRNGFVSMVGGGDSGRGRIPANHRNIASWKAASGIDWMTAREMTQAIPPAYTEWIGKQLMRCFL